MPRIFDMDNPQMRWHRRGVSLGVMSFCLYAPFFWVIEPAWHGYRVGAVQMWPVLPGFVVGAFFDPNETAMQVAMGVTTAVLFALLVPLGALGWRGMLLACAIALALEIPNSLLARWAFAH